MITTDILIPDFEANSWWKRVEAIDSGNSGDDKFEGEFLTSGNFYRLKLGDLVLSKCPVTSKKEDQKQIQTLWTYTLHSVELEPGELRPVVLGDELEFEKFIEECVEYMANTNGTQASYQTVLEMTEGILDHIELNENLNDPGIKDLQIAFSRTVNLLQKTDIYQQDYLKTLQTIECHPRYERDERDENL